MPRIGRFRHGIRPYIGPSAVYVDALLGNDANTGGSSLSPIQTLTRLEALFPADADGIPTVPPNTTIYFKAGQYHRRASLRLPVVGPGGNGGNGAALHIGVDAAATALSRPKIRTYGGSARAFISGDFLIATGWSAATSGETNATAVALGCEKRTMGAGYTHANFPCVDDFMLQPACWHPPSAETATGYPSSIHSWDSGEVGSDGIYRYNESGASPNPQYADADGATEYPVVTAEFMNKKVGSLRYVRITNPAIAAHYGSYNPTGAWVSYLAGYSTQFDAGIIVDYNQAESWIEFTCNYYNGGAPAAFPFWNIKGCPFDIVKEGQYGYSADHQTLFATFPAGSTSSTRSIARQEAGVRLYGKLWDWKDVGISRICTWIDTATDNANSYLHINGPDHTFDNLFLKQSIDPGRGNSISTKTGGSNPVATANVVFTNTRIEESRNKRGFAVSTGQNWLVDGAELYELGRTALYVDGNPSFYPSSGCVFRNINIPNNSSVHGNGISVYPQGLNATFEYIGICSSWGLNLTAQTNATPISNRANSHLNSMWSNFRRISTSATGVFGNGATGLARLYGSENNSQYRHMLAIGEELTFQSGGDLVVAATNYGTVLSNVVACAVTFSKAAINGVQLGSGYQMTFENVLTYLDKYTGEGRTVWANAGVTLDADSKMDLADIWTGTLSDQQWKYLTKVGATAAYAAAQIGPSQWGWTVPAYGTAITLSDVTMDNTWVRKGYQAGRTIGTIVRTSPKSTLSLPAGQGDNSLFFLDAVRKNVVVAATNLSTPGTYSLVVRETNTSAVGGFTASNYRDTTVSIIVRPDA